MKKILILGLLFILCSAGAELKEEKKDNFFSVSYNNHFFPLQEYRYSFKASSPGLAYGRKINKGSFFSLGLIGTNISMNYEYTFSKSSFASTGFSIGALAGISKATPTPTTRGNQPSSKSKETVEQERTGPFLAAGVLGDLYLSLGSDNWRGRIKTGLQFSSAINRMSENFEDKLSHYIGIEFRRYF